MSTDGQTSDGFDGDGDFDAASFWPEFDGDHPDKRTADWFHLKDLGFHATVASQERLNFYTRMYRADNRRLHAVYARQLPLAAWDGPVAITDTFTKSLNAGGESLDAFMFSGVVVRPTHRRRGLLRSMMTRHLHRAHNEGFPVALLKASEGGIYRRFGFAPVAYERHVNVDTSSRFAMLTPPPGRVEVTEPSNLMGVAPDLFAGFHARQPGSVDRLARFAGIVSGTADRFGNSDNTIRAALHYDDAGVIDGYVSYRSTGSPPQLGIEIVDLIAVEPGAYLGLWDFLASIDLVEYVRWTQAPVHDPLSLALADPRVVSTVGETDSLWMRILDVPAILEALGYVDDGELMIRVHDTYGLTDGRYELSVSGGSAQVTRHTTGGSCDVDCDVADLAALVFGTAHPATLAASARLTEGRAGGVRRAAALLAGNQPIYCPTDF